MNELITSSNPVVIFLTFLLGLVFIASSCQQADREAAAAQHEELATSYVEALNTQDREALEDVITDPFTYGEQEMTREAFLDHVEGGWEIFPDMQFDPTHVLTAEDYVTVCGVLTGTGEGEYHGHDISGQEFEVTEIILLGVQEGQIARMHVERDDLDLWEQIAAVEISPVSSNQDDETLQRLEREVFDAFELPGDAGAIDRLYSEDLLAINADASYSDKQEAVEIVEAGRFPFMEEIVNDETRVRQFGDTAVVTGRSKWVDPEDEGTAVVRHTMIWEKEDGRWQMAGWQGTPLPGEGAYGPERGEI
ncbi:DUF4440 domain-containing protein [Rhodohalobacter sp. SW132]|uniref:nuclear transport factor 2 family protein n=1 Tax=Rhodohalobacter sp. SW132 TaxID=2293433 RepID=UPI000E28A5D3|nr:nuclear transport factor 2 family protein [Rhodohalobacter sp. SW132]REL33790.1 DUF4440 domain-containing protein [Rhodohalobacter sp. SW132]